MAPPPPILLVEDDLSLAHTLSLSIERSGLPVEHCPSGELAIELLRTRDYAVAVIDIVLADGISGMYVVNAIRRLPPHRRPRALVITGTNVDTLRGLERTIVAAVLLKPLNFTLFSEYVLATYRVAMADRASRPRPVETFCGSCREPLPPWLPERLPLRDHAAEHAAFERWLDTPCTNCGAVPRMAGGYSSL